LQRTVRVLRFVLKSDDRQAAEDVRFGGVMGALGFDTSGVL